MKFYHFPADVKKIGISLAIEAILTISQWKWLLGNGYAGYLVVRAEIPDTCDGIYKPNSRYYTDVIIKGEPSLSQFLSINLYSRLIF